MIERPKLLSVITVPAGGWLFRVQLSDAGAYDHTANATLAAGDYYLSGDGASTDLLCELCTKATAAIRALGAPFATGFVYSWIDPTHKVNLYFVQCSAAAAARPIKIVWTACAAGLALALGFDTAADDVLNAVPLSKQADYHHAYGWYCDEDGCLASKPLVDTISAQMQQARSLGGVVRTQRMSSWLHDSNFNLEFLTNTKTFSDETVYGSLPPYPRNRNEAFECLWYEIAGGKQFRFYRNYSAVSTPSSFSDSAVRCEARCISTGSGGGYEWVSPDFVNDQFNGGHIVGMIWSIVDAVLAGNSLGVPYTSIINDVIHSFAGANCALGVNIPPGLAVGFLWGNHGLLYPCHQTYVIDVNQSGKFEPQEITGLDRFNISFKMMRYVAP